MRLGLGTFESAQETARPDDAAAWRLNRPGREMNFPEVMTLEWAQSLVPHPRIVIEEDRRQNRKSAASPLE
ncbi:hypothetical protein D1007_46458 [Hordeum vulgare]|nr:hypothetical protein D1007_46458 [Hordeum vulgare]